MNILIKLEQVYISGEPNCFQLFVNIDKFIFPGFCIFFRIEKHAKNKNIWKTFNNKLWLKSIIRCKHKLYWQNLLLINFPLNCSTSKLDHCCAPNCVYTYNGTEQIIRALTYIEQPSPDKVQCCIFCLSVFINEVVIILIKYHLLFICFKVYGNDSSSSF